MISTNSIKGIERNAASVVAHGLNVAAFDQGDARNASRPASAFAARLAAALPEVVAVRMDGWDQGILHLEVGALKLATRDAIELGNWDDVAEHFRFAAYMYDTADVRLRDAMEVSYLGMLFHGEKAENYARARRLLPPRLAMALQRVERHYETREMAGSQEHEARGESRGASSHG